MPLTAAQVERLSGSLRAFLAGATEPASPRAMAEHIRSEAAEVTEADVTDADVNAVMAAAAIHAYKRAGIDADRDYRHALSRASDLSAHIVEQTKRRDIVLRHASRLGATVEQIAMACDMSRAEVREITNPFDHPPGS